MTDKLLCLLLIAKGLDLLAKGWYMENVRAPSLMALLYIGGVMAVILALSVLLFGAKL
jgi:hypothetical protein